MVSRKPGTKPETWCVAAVALALALAALAHAEKVEYKTELVWECPEEDRTILEAFAQTAFAEEDEALASRLHLRRRATRQADYMSEAMRSEGYYAGSAVVRLDEDTSPLTLAITIAPGPRYVYEPTEIRPAEGVLPESLPGPEGLPIAPGAPARAADMIATRKALINAMRQAGHPFAAVGTIEAVVDHATHTVRLSFALEPGPTATLGPVRIEGLTGVLPRVVEKEVPWAAGDAYAPDTLENLQQRLYATDLFSVARVHHADALDAEGRLPIDVEVAERKHRTVSLGLRYYTDDGAGMRTQWEHRNMRHAGHRLRSALDLGTRNIGLDTGYRIRRFRHPGQDFEAKLDVGREDTDAYESLRFEPKAWLERRLTDRLKVSYGTGFRLSRVTPEKGDEDTYGLLFFPGDASYDRSNNKLDPTGGFRLQGGLTPYLSVLDVGNSFTKTQLSGSVYLGLGAEDQWVLAARLGIGLLAGAAREDVPPDLRYHAGGGGSVRGYAYQLAGPLDEDDHPLGGRSLIETAFEVRYRMSETIGLAAFVDGGSVFDSVCPDMSGGLLWGAGLGARYFTPLGPLRFDVAVPLNKRSVDSSFQLYISIGQAF